MGDKLVFAVYRALKKLDNLDENRALVDYLQDMAPKVDIEKWQKHFQRVTALEPLDYLSLAADDDFNPLIKEWEVDNKIPEQLKSTKDNKIPAKDVKKSKKDRLDAVIKLLARYCTKMIVSGIAINFNPGYPNWRRLLILHTNYLYRSFVKDEPRLKRDRKNARKIIDLMIEDFDEFLGTAEARICVYHMGNQEQIALVNIANAEIHWQKYYENLFPIHDYDEYRSSLAGDSLHILKDMLTEMEEILYALRTVVEPQKETAVLTMTTAYGVTFTTPKAITFGKNIAFVKDVAHPSIVLAAAVLGITFGGGIFDASKDFAKERIEDYDSIYAGILKCGTILETRDRAGVNTDFGEKIPLPLYNYALSIYNGPFFNLSRYKGQFFPTYNLCFVLDAEDIVEGIFLYRVDSTNTGNDLLAQASLQEANRRVELLKKTIAHLEPLPPQIKDVSLRPILDARAQNITDLQIIIDSSNVKIRELTKERNELMDEQLELQDMKKAYQKLTDEIKEQKRIQGDAQNRIEFYSQPIFEDLPWESAAATYAALLKMSKDLVSVEDKAKYNTSLRYLSDNWDEYPGQE
jgi:hypothetical protein